MPLETLRSRIARALGATIFLVFVLLVLSTMGETSLIIAQTLAPLDFVALVILAISLLVIDFKISHQNGNNAEA